jgi:hypothetical protein
VAGAKAAQPSQAHEAFLAYEKTHPPHGGGRFQDLGAARIALSIYDENVTRTSISIRASKNVIVKGGLKSKKT